MVGKQPIKTQIQVIAEQQITFNLTTVGTTQIIIYTVPAGKKTKVRSWSGIISTLGSNTQIFTRVNTLQMTIATASNSNFNDGGYSPEGIMLQGDTLNFVGNNAANDGHLVGIATVLELPIPV